VWTWENRAARVVVGRPTNKVNSDNDGANELPADGAWSIYWVSGMDFMQATLQAPNAFAHYLRLHIGRGYPLVVSTDATEGHIMIISGLVLRNNGSVHKITLNDLMAIWRQIQLLVM